MTKAQRRRPLRRYLPLILYKERGFLHLRRKRLALQATYQSYALHTGIALFFALAQLQVPTQRQAVRFIDQPRVITGLGERGLAVIAQGALLQGALALVVKAAT